MLTLERLIAFTAALLAVGLPPDTSDEAGFRNWCTRLNDALDMLASMTATPQDDASLRLLRAVVRDDECWAAFYSILAGSDGLQPMGTPAASAAIGQAAAVDPTVVVAIVQMVMQFIEMWRKRK